MGRAECHYSDMSKATGAQKPSETQKNESFFWQPGTEVESTMIQLAKKTFWEEQRHIWNSGKTRQRSILQHWKIVDSH